MRHGAAAAGSAWLMRLMAVILLQVALHAAAQPAVFPGTHWTQVDAQQAGWSAAGLAAADEQARALRTSAYLVVHHGRIVHRFGDIEAPSNVHSVRKSVLSILFGIEFDRGHVDLERDLLSLAIDDREGLTPREQQARVRHLLQARSCIYHPSAYEPAATAARHPPRGTCAPGERFEYNNWDFNALGTIFGQVAGHDVFEALERDLAGPIGFEDFRRRLHTRWVHERLRSRHPAYEMQLSARDMARVGLLMARGGVWQGRRIVSERWVRESTTSYSVVGSGSGYGYMWWVGLADTHFANRMSLPVFSARGNHGQFIVVHPARDLVIVHKVDTSRRGHADVDVRAFGRLLTSVLKAAPG